MIEKFKKDKMFKKARKLQKIYDKVKTSKPKIENVCPELDERFVKIDLDNSTSFDGWISLTSLGEKLKLELPFKKTEHFNKIFSNGIMKKGIRISNNKVTFNFLMNKPILKTEGITLGIDIGIKDVVSLSNGSEKYFKKNIHNHTLESIQNKLSRKTKGSKSFKKAQKHRNNHIKWLLNQINFDNVKVLRLENIKYLRKGTKTSRYMSHWVYPLIKNKLEDLALWSGVQTVKISPTYTSQRCSKCGWTRKKNRKGKKFVCSACGFACDADHNASVNISLDLPEISKAERLLHKNKNGFYWSVMGQEPIVPDAQKARVEISELF
jgi:transposase